MSADRTGTGLISDTAFAAAIIATAALVGLVWLGAVASAWLSGHRIPPFTIVAVVALPRNWRQPSIAWGQLVGPPWLYWLSTLLLVGAAIAAAKVLIVRFPRPSGDTRPGPAHATGLASRAEVRRAAGGKALVARSTALRPELMDASEHDLGYPLGRSRGVPCWASAEDSVVILGPPRSGKGLHLVIPMILDAPGAVITTSTRPDNLTAALGARRAVGPVAVFDPQRLAPGVASEARWSPTRGCANPRTALIRARALAAGTASGTSEPTFWQAAAEQAVRCLLHAAALAGATAEDLYRWSLSAVAAGEAAEVLAEDPRAAPGWQQALTALLETDAKQRDSVWAMVALSLGCFADPHVLDAVSPAPGEEFDPETFLQRSSTVYLLGTSSGSAATSGLIGAFVEDVVEVARRLAAASSGGRLDPPLAVILDEAANYRVPSLASLMSEGGGTGISTTVVLQSLAQARAVWGDHAGAALWDSAIVKLILGGGSNARDLDDLSRLIGTRTARDVTHSIGPDGRRSHSASEKDKPILEPGQLRQLPFGTGVLLLRSARPILLSLQRWLDRPDAYALQRSQQELEGRIRDAHAATLE
jgi:type IV secretion system protein VirD4